MSETAENYWEAPAGEFLERFTPPEAVEEWGYDAHGLLYDFKGKYHFTPATTQLTECVTAYLQLLEETTSESSAVILALLDPSELALAYLRRAEAAQILYIPWEVRDRLFTVIGRIVGEMRSLGGIYDGDAVKRIVSISEYLEEDVLRRRNPETVHKERNPGDEGELRISIPNPDFKRKILEAETRKNSLKEGILAYLRDHGGEAEAFAIWYDLSIDFPGMDIITALFELADEVKIKADKEPLMPSNLSKSTKFKLLE
jgi:hypothetical protein